MIYNQQTFDLAMISGEVRYPEDCALIVRIAKEKLGIVMTPMQAQIVWKYWSDTHCAGWLIVDSYDMESIIDAIKSFIDTKLNAPTEEQS